MKKSCILLALLFVNCLIAQQTEDLNLKGENERLKNGINSGELNRSEIEVISDKKYELKKTTSQAKRDGVITPEERAKITRKDAQLDSTIYRKKHNSTQHEDLNLKGENERLKNGINSGELNRSEIEVISDKKYELKKTTSQAKRDGVITPEERAKITRKDAQLDRTIYKKKHNNK